ncbi:hypothetical protein ACJ6WF_49500 [Streptomyces sp. MMS24-I2-30]|uniref:hypothetical protein n=1 Tax=Streptomyces sp. MMS24-I2-30 TaxID=3351564 RepID=UPI003896D480
MTGTPGIHPVRGDTIQLIADGTLMIFKGDVMTREVRRDGNGFIEITLPADPQQRRDLERARSYQFSLYRDGLQFYTTPRSLRVVEIRRASDGALVVTGAP